MIKSVFLFAALISCSFIYGSASSPSKHDIAAVLQSVNVRVDVALTEQGALEPVQQAFVRTNQGAGTFAVRVTRIGSNLYRIDGTSIFLQTRFCYEYSYGQSAVVTIRGGMGYTVGSIEFQ